ncbi:MAG: hypothetical protein Q7S45_00565 [Candidatus Curtissbacteria bacterium]|nr:hypothetical protein [Candidatus Curtissbacteria bacterium]
MESHEIPKIAGQEFTSRPNPDFKTQTCFMTLREINKQKPEIAPDMQTILEEIERQSIDNFAIYESKEFPGVAFSYTKLTVTPEIVKKIAGENYRLPDSNPQDQNPENRVIFEFGVFTPPPNGHALSLLDMPIDRFIRNIPKVFHTKEGHIPPTIDIYALGSPIGYGGTVTPEYLEALIKNGLEANGRIYGEFMNEKLRDLDPKNTHVLAQGASMGAINADQAVLHLLPDFKEQTQVLLDVPAGHHNPKLVNRLKGLQTAVMFGAETGTRMLFDPKMKGLGNRTKKLYQYLSQAKNIPADGSDQTRLKWRCLYETGLKLVKGSPLEESQRHFIRAGIYDPLTTGPKRFFDTYRRWNKNIVFKGIGHSLEFPIATTHFWFYTQRFNRWERIIKNCKGIKETKKLFPEL